MSFIRPILPIADKNNMPLVCCYVLCLLFFSLRLSAQPLFDSHLHYSEKDAQIFNPQAIINLLDKNAIHYAAVTGTSPEYVSKLYHLAPTRILPLLGVSYHSADKTTWTKDEDIIPYLETELDRGYWRGIGELHIFARDRHSEVFKKVVALASSRRLPLLIHSDPAIIDRIYELSPTQQVIWAHAGRYPYPDLVSDYLHRYPNLFVDVSMRDQRIAPDGVINDVWYELFVTYPDRFLVGVDTYSIARWKDFDAAVGTILNWLAQLPGDIAMQLAFMNAAKLYNTPQKIIDEENADGIRQQEHCK